MISFKDFLSESLSEKDSPTESQDRDSTKAIFSPADGFEDTFRIPGIVGEKFGSTLEEGLTIPENPEDEIETELREKLGKGYEWGDLVIGWYRNEKKAGKDEKELEQTYVRDLDNILDMLKDYDDLVERYRKYGFKDKVKIEVGGKTFELDPVKNFTSKKLRKPLAGKLLVKALGDLVRSDDEIDSSVQKYQILPEDRKNIRLLASTEHVMCWATKTYDSTNKLVFQLWQNTKTLGRGDAYGDPSEQSPFCTHSKQHWDNYSDGDPEYTQFWYLEKPEGQFDWTPGDLSRPNVAKIFNAMKGKGPELILGLDDTGSDSFLNREDEHSFEDVRYPEEIRRIAKDFIFKGKLEDPSKFMEIEDGTLKKFDISEKLMPYVTDVTIPDDVTSIGDHAFYDCFGLTSVTIPDSVTSIEWYAFRGCTGLTSVTIPDSVTRIGGFAFSYCSGLTSVEIPNSVTSIGQNAFYSCSGLTGVTIPNSVTDIGIGAFSYCSGLTSVTIPDSVTSIGDWAFYECSGLTSVTIPASVTGIGEGAFSDCSGLTDVTIPKRFDGELEKIFGRNFGSIEFTFTGSSEKSLSEEKVFAKEDEGGSPSGGGEAGGSLDGGSVVAPSGGNSDQGVVSPEINPGLDTQDVLGKCDHGKDGFFGPGCFHLPHNIFSVPYYRLPKKKKRRKNMGTANLKEDGGYQDFEKYAKERINQIVEEINGNMLSRIDPDLTVEYEPDYEFSDEKQDWVASLDMDGQTDSKVFPVGINIPAIYDFLYENGLEMDNLETDLQLRAALYHEVGHAILRYLEDNEIADMELGSTEEEKVVEEFAKYHLRKYTGQASSRLEDVIWELFGERMTEKDGS